MIVFKFIVQHQTNVSVTETSSKMASTKSSKFCVVRTIYDLVQIPPACGPNTNQIMYGATLDFRCRLKSSISGPLSGNISVTAVRP